MRVLALDCASNVGWAVLDSPRSVLKFGTWRAPGAHLHDNLGRAFVALEEFLIGAVVLFHPDVIAFEAPLTLFYGGHERAGPEVVRLLIGMATVVELVATRGKMRCIEVPVPTAKKRLCGNSYATKRDMVNAVVKLGHLVEDDHQADAIAVGLATFDHLIARGGLL
jgi:Holliday junction resolvasome RuvABC endonuclease subunit